MSLLLDALNRASLDKAALAAAAQAQAGKKASPAEPLEPTPPGMAADVPADVPTGAAPLGFADAASPAWPSLELSALKAVPDVTVELPPKVASSEPLSPGMFDPPGAQAALSLAPRFQEPNQPALPALSALPEFANLADPLPIPDLVPLAAPQAAATTAAPTEASFSRTAGPAAFETEPAASEAGSMPPDENPTAADARPQPMPMPGNGNGNRVAQNLLRAKRPPTAKSRTRVMVLASVAVALVLATAMGAVFLGALGDPLVLAQNLGLVAPQQPLAPPSGSLTPTQVADSAVPAVATAEPAAVASAQSASAAPPLPVAEAAARKTVVAGSSGSSVSPGPVSSRPRMAMAVPASSLACPPGTLPPDCKAANLAGNVGQGLQGSVQSRSSGPSILEQGYSALTQGRLQEAETVYLRALKVNPEERDALLGMAYIAQKQQRSDDAQAYYRRVLRQEPDNAVARAGLLALNSLSNSQEFGSQSRLLAEQNPASAAAQSMLGHALVRQDRLADAQLAFARALQLEPGVARHAFNLAVALDRLHDYDAAQRYYERALALLAQSGGERASGFALADVQLRLAQLRPTE